jgi:hypothetical protein
VKTTPVVGIMSICSKCNYLVAIGTKADKNSFAVVDINLSFILQVILSFCPSINLNIYYYALK